MTGRSLFTSLFAFAAAIAAAFPAAAQQVGVSSAVNPATTGQAPGQASRQLVVGENIVFNHHITTGPDGQTQILFVDESAMSIGPNSDMTVDEFVYDPKTGTGKEALSATQGVFRYVGGKLSKLADPVTIRTPVATIGIRGGVFVMDLQRSGHLNVVFIYGKGLTITGANGITETITRPGFGVTISGRGASPTPPAPAPKAALSSFLSALDGKSGSSAGASSVPTDTTVANSGVSQTVSGNVAASVQQAQQQVQTQTPAANQASNPTNQPANLNLNTVTSQSQPVIQNSITGQTGGVPNATGLSGGGTGINNANSTAGFTNEVTPFSGGQINNGVFISTIGNSSVQFPIAQGTATGTGTYTDDNGNPISINVTTVRNPDGTFFYAAANAVGDTSKLGFVWGGQPVSPSAYAPTGAPQFLAYQVQPDAALNSPVPFVTNQTGGAIPNATVSPLYVAVAPNTGFTTSPNSQSAFPKALQASLAINGAGADQSSMLAVATGNAFTLPGSSSPVLNGVVEGSYRASGATPSTLTNSSYLTAIDGANNSFYGNNTIEGFVLTPNTCCTQGQANPALASQTNTQTGASTSYGFAQAATAVATPAIASGPQTSQTLTGFFGGTMTGVKNGVVTPYALTGATVIATDASQLQIAAVLAGSNPNPGAGGANNVAMSFGSLSPGDTGAREGYINNNLFGVLETPGGGGSTVNNSAVNSANLYLVDANAVPNNTLLANGTLCQQCQYLQWGYWGGQLNSGSGADARTDIAHINTWVAGTPTPNTDINNLVSMSAQASYGGSAIGSVNNNGSNYLAAGTFSQNYNFGTQTGSIAINNFDGRSFGGTVHGTTNSPAYAGTLTGTNLSGSTAGFFFGPKAAETGGNFAVQSITGLPYIAAGTFAGKKNP